MPDVVEECARKRVHGLVIISAGFAEVGTDGKQAERAIVATARRNGMRIIGPNCLGIVNTAPGRAHERDVRAGRRPSRGPVGVPARSRAGSASS